MMETIDRVMQAYMRVQKLEEAQRQLVRHELSKFIAELRDLGGKNKKPKRSRRCI